MKTSIATFLSICSLISVAAQVPSYRAVTNISEAVVERDVPSWARQPNPPSGGGVNTNDVKNIATEVVNSYVPKYETWNRPGLWSIGSEIVSGVITNYVSVTNVDEYGRTTEDYEYDVNGGRVARLNQIKLDEIALYIPPVASWTSLTDGATIVSNTISSVTDGVYRVQATDASNVVKYALINLSAYRSEKVSGLIYSADTMQSRNDIYDFSVSILTNAQYLGQVQDEGKSYNVYGTIAHTNMFPSSVGNVRQSAFSQHILMGAHHYRIKPCNTQQFGNTTIQKLAWVSLYDWALTNGFTKAEVDEANCSDIDMIICSKSTAVPDEFIPYFTTAEKISHVFGTAEGLPAWATGQLTPHPYPIMIKSLDTHSTISNLKSCFYKREDWWRAVSAKDNWIPVISGDSGKMIYLEYDNKQIALSSFWSARGTNYSKSHRIIKAFVEWYGDTLKVW